MKTVARSLLSLVLISLAASAASANESIYQSMLKSTVMVLAGDASGTGSLVDAERKLIVTNFHVVREETEVSVLVPRFEEGLLITEKAKYRAKLDELKIAGKVIETDRRRDLALIQLEEIPAGLQPIPLATTAPNPGATVHSMGNPNASDALWIYSQGTVRQVYNKNYVLSEDQDVSARIVETQSALNPGDSGGPVCNDAGELVAVVSANSTSGNLVNACIEVSEVKSLLAGENKTIDARIRIVLDEEGLQYEVNKFGVYTIEMPLAGGKRIVFAESRTSQEEGSLVRPVWSPVAVEDEPLSDSLKQRLLGLNESTTVGEWRVQEIGKKHVGLFLVQVNADDSDALRRQMKLVAETAADVELQITSSPNGSVAATPEKANPAAAVPAAEASAVPAPEATAIQERNIVPAATTTPAVPVAQSQPATEPAPSPGDVPSQAVPAPAPVAAVPSLAGTWKAVIVDSQGEAVVIGLVLGKDGSIRFLATTAYEQLLDVRGSYSFDGNTLSWIVSGQEKAAGIKILNKNSFAFSSPTIKTTFTRLYLAPADCGKFCTPGFVCH